MTFTLDPHYTLLKDGQPVLKLNPSFARSPHLPGQMRPYCERIVALLNQAPDPFAPPALVVTDRTALGVVWSGLELLDQIEEEENALARDRLMADLHPLLWPEGKASEEPEGYSPKAGERVRFIKPWVLEFPLEGTIEADERGTVFNVAADAILVRLDHHYPALDEWQNVVQLHREGHDAPESYLAKIEPEDDVRWASDEWREAVAKGETTEGFRDWLEARRAARAKAARPEADSICFVDHEGQVVVGVGHNDTVAWGDALFRNPAGITIDEWDAGRKDGSVTSHYCTDALVERWSLIPREATNDPIFAWAYLDEDERGSPICLPEEAVAYAVALGKDPAKVRIYDK